MTQSGEDAFAIDDQDRPRAKTALVLIHGMGEQRPMATLWDFVEAVWTDDRDMVATYNGAVYAKPDGINPLLDLRRVTTRYWSGEDPRRIDFFEYYWAHLMVGNTIRGTVDWILGLFIRSPASVPKGLRSIWLAGLCFLLLAMILFVAAALPQSLSDLVFDRRAIVALGAVSAIASLAASRWLAPVAGDAARYFSPDPDNVEAREKIIRGGVELIENLTRSGDYDRIIVVGHSLGSAIGLDILDTAFGKIRPDDWAQAHQADGRAAERLALLEKIAGRAEGGTDEDDGGAADHVFPLDAYRDAQRSYANALAAGWDDRRSPWLVSDFVTLGSPLSKAHVLISRTEHDFAKLKAKRQVPTCPPRLEQKSPPRFSFRARGGVMVPHHGALFAPTVWTNIYFPSRAFIFGDIVSGPVAPLFGPAVRDVRMPTTGWRFRHLDYWRLAGDTPPDQVRALRNAINFRERTEAALWAQDLPPPSVTPPPPTDTQDD